LCYLSFCIPLPGFSCLSSIERKLFIFSFKALNSLRFFFLSIICALSLRVSEMSAPGPIQPAVPNGADAPDLDPAPVSPAGPSSLAGAHSCGAFVSAEAFWLQGWERGCPEPARPAAEPGWMSLPSARGGPAGSAGPALLWVALFSPWLRPGLAALRQSNVSALWSCSPELDFSVARCIPVPAPPGTGELLYSLVCHVVWCGCYGKQPTCSSG